MCGVIGYYSKSPDYKLLKKLFKESSIRGLHATGLTYVNDQKLNTIIVPCTVKQFLHKHKLEEFRDINHGLYLIGHVRYSTSDLDWNQPIVTDLVSIVHNGVVTQEPYENWKEKFGISCEGKNDSELILRTILDKQNPFEVWPTSSMAVIELWFNRNIKFYRNGKRPLWYSLSDEALIIASTNDIFKRVGINDAIKCNSMCMYNYDGYKLKTVQFEQKKDLQSV